MVKDYISMGFLFTALALLYLIGTPFLVVAGVVTYINKIWSK